MKKYLGIAILCGSFILAIVLLGLGLVIARATRTDEKVISRNATFSNFTKLDYAAVGDLEIVQGEQEGVSITGPETFVNNIKMSQSDNTLKIGSTDPMKLQLFNFDFLGEGQLKVLVTVKDLNSIQKSGTGNFSINGFTTDNMIMTLSGTGDSNFQDLRMGTLALTMSGTGNLKIDGLGDNISLNLVKTGMGNFEAQGIANKNITIKQSGTGDINLNGKTATLTLNMSGVGNAECQDLQAQNGKVTISGTGDVTVNVSGDLQVTKNSVGNLNYYGNPRLSLDNKGVGNISNKGAFTN